MKPSIFSAAVLVSSLFIVSACTQESVDLQPSPSGLPYQSNFQQNTDGWAADLTDYSQQQADMEFTSSLSSLPIPLDANRKAIMVSSMNRSDDAFMFVKKKLTGLQPNTDYTLVFDIELASAYADNSFGIGGSPGSSVYLKAGATATEPKPTLKNGFYELNIDKGNQAEGGRDAVLLGNIGIGADKTDYTLITRSNADKPVTARTNAQGELWLIVGTDSGYEGQTTLYYSRINVTVK